MDNFTTYTYDEEGNLVDEVTIEVPISTETQARRQAIQDYKDASGALLTSNVSATVKAFVRAERRLLKHIVSELQNDEVE